MQPLRRQAPNFAEAGGFAKERNVILEMKLIADVGLVGFPNVGKSTLLSVSTSAKPKIANYHFTTIDPNLGVVKIYDTSFVMADIAGIIEGAPERGWPGTQIPEAYRTHQSADPCSGCIREAKAGILREDFDKINKELEQYSEKLLKKPQIVAANKIDLVWRKIRKSMRISKAYVEEQGYEVFPMSAPINQKVSRKSLQLLPTSCSRFWQNHRKRTIMNSFDFEKHENDPDYRTVTVSYDGKSFVLHGKQLLKIFDSTNST